jgi:hypothetical protein
MNIFPLNTNSYPVTRTIRVESSCIIVIFLVGCIINMKLWKILKKHRAEESAERKNKEMDLEKMESRLGLRTELEVARERRAWEKTYGQQKSTTAFTSAAISAESLKRSSKGSHDRPLSEANTIEVLEMDVANNFRPSIRTTPRRISGAAGITINTQEIQGFEGVLAKEIKTSPRREVNAPESRGVPEARPTSKARTAPEVPLGPVVVPLPLPMDPSSMKRGGRKSPNRASIAAEDCIKDVSAAPSSPFDKEGSEEMQDDFDSEEDDAYSSLEANLDDLDRRSVPRSSLTESRCSSLVRDPEAIPLPESHETSRSGSVCETAEHPTAPEDSKVKGQNIASLKSPPKPQNRESFASAQDYITSEPDTDGHPDGQSMSDLTDMSLDKLKGRTSNRVLRAFKHQKTFEWAKQSTLAETPPIEEIPRPSSPGVLPEVNTETQDKGKKTRSRVVGEEEFLLPNEAGELQEPRPTQTVSETTSPRRSMTDPMASLILNPLHMDAQKSFSTPNLLNTQRIVSNPTSPRGSVMTISESPTRQEQWKPGSEQVPTPNKSETLLGKREQHLRKRLSAGNLTTMPVSAFLQSSPNKLSSPQSTGQARSPPVTRTTSPSPGVQNEAYVSVPRQVYSRQKTYPQLQAGTVSSLALPSMNSRNQSTIGLRQDSLPAGSSNNRSSVYLPDMRAPRIGQQDIIGEFNSHQPQRENDRQTTEQRAARLASWRVSLQNDAGRRQQGTASSPPAKIPTGAIDAHRELMIREKKIREHREMQKGAERARRNQVMDRTMRAPDAIALHSKRLSELQSKVKMG